VLCCGVVWCVGGGGGWAVGHRSKGDAILPVVVEALRQKSVRYVDAGDAFAVAVTDAGHVYVWGEGDEFQLGLGKANKQSSTYVSAAARCTLAPPRPFSVWSVLTVVRWLCWLCVCVCVCVCSPYLLTSLLKANRGISYVACGRAHVLALSGSGQVYAWGAGDKGQVGQGKSEAEPYPVLVPLFEGKAAQFIAAGGNNSAAIIAGAGGKRELYLWGANDNGVLATGDSKASAVPVRCAALSDSADPVATLDLGFNFAAAVTEGGALWTWGSNSHGQLGHGDTKDQFTPKPVKYFADKKLHVTLVSLGENHVICAAKKGADPSVYTWGAGIVNAFKSVPAPRSLFAWGCVFARSIPTLI
jgi:alpha-tubulin suppressor-like RCC1 family protein